jgi:NAD(P)H-nitrite reductase large subunit
MSQYVIIGSGAAGISAAEAIRSLDKESRLTMISGEPAGYYSRPGLAYYLSGEIEERFLFPFQQQDFRDLKINFILARVTAIRPDQHKVILSDGRLLSYDKLLIATGAKAAQMKIAGIDLEGVVQLDNLEGVRQITKLARKGRSAVVVGGGITALELVEGLRARRVKTNYFLRGDRYWSNVLDKSESRIVEHRLAEDGVRIHYHTELVEILGKRGRVIGVLTQADRQIKCDLVGIAIGVRPRMSLAVEAGIKTDRGILVDQYLRTDAPDIYAAGDVAQVFDPFSGKSALDSLWGTAREQGATAGLNMVGLNKAYLKAVPFNVTRLAGLTTTIIGTVGRGDDKDLAGIARGDSETWRELPDAIAAQVGFQVNRLRVLVGPKTLLGAIVMGDQTLSRPIHRLVADQVDITPIRDQLLQPGAPLADLLADFWTLHHKTYAATTQ